jgi:hypothetical protein
MKTGRIVWIALSLVLCVLGTCFLVASVHSESLFADAGVLFGGTLIALALSPVSILVEGHSLDRCVLDAYGWTDVQPRCEFIPAFDDEGEEDENGRIREKKYRYRWPDEIRDEILARLLELNRRQALGEVISTASASETFSTEELAE